MTDYQALLGRIPSMKDEAQRRYRFTADLEDPMRFTLASYKYHYTRWRPRQSGGTCTGHGVTQVFAGGPVTNKITPATPYEVYDYAIRHDVWTDNDYDPSREFGSSVDAAMMAGIEFGWWPRVEWCTSLSQMLVALQKNMVCNGTWWTDAMFETDAKGFLHFEGDMVGGHAWATYGYNLKIPYRVKGLGTDSYAIRHGVTANVNSWGLGWGKEGKGTFLLSFEDHESLIQADGECATPVEERKAA